MELALYAPGLGYYSAGATKFGEAGDFITAPELGSLFADGVAQAVSALIRELGPDAEFIELGGGSGAFAEDALKRLDELDALPARYRILEPSAQLRQRQQERIAALDDRLSARVEWLDRPPHEPFGGVIFANEVLDALPTTRFRIHDGEVFEEGIAIDDDGSLRTARIQTDALVAQAVRGLERNLGIELPDGYTSELLPQLPYWIQAVCGGLRRGLALFVDYGYPRREFYLPERSDGTLVCHYRHRAHGDALHLPGLQDITAFVDFTAVAEAGHHAGLELAGYSSQAQFLLGNGLPERVESLLAGADTEAQYRLTQQVKRLTLPGDMGERFQVMGLSRGINAEALFATGDRRHRL
ncbi:MAG: SAM-dependent methyltransferase [Xanthomonadales bacterium]|nr:SAM-dependent methyltransferase [Xanthomonadales bacterium]